MNKFKIIMNNGITHICTSEKSIQEVMSDLFEYDLYMLDEDTCIVPAFISSIKRSNV